jgi:hypothetical protein
MWSKNDIIRETRWSRVYAKADKPRHQYLESRFMDGSATITLEELQRDWRKWPEDEKIDFCQSLVWAPTPERKDILRFVIDHGDHRAWSAIALLVALELSPQESVPALRRWCESCEVGRGANYYQAVAKTGDPEAHDILKRCVHRIWKTDGLMEDAEFCNWVAYDAICCVEYLLELNEDRDDLRSFFQALKTHPCKATRRDARRRLAKYFPGKDAH